MNHLHTVRFEPFIVSHSISRSFISTSETIASWSYFLARLTFGSHNFTHVSLHPDTHTQQNKSFCQCLRNSFIYASLRWKEERHGLSSLYFIFSAPHNFHIFPASSCTASVKICLILFYISCFELWTFLLNFSSCLYFLFHSQSCFFFF